MFCREYLELDLTLSQEKVQNIAGVAVAHINGFTAELRRLFLVEDLIDSIKFGVILWVFTYIGAWFNGMTLVILGKQRPQLLYIYNITISSISSCSLCLAVHLAQGLREQQAVDRYLLGSGAHQVDRDYRQVSCIIFSNRSAN